MLRRRILLANYAAALVAPHNAGSQVSKRLKFVPQIDVPLLDPVMTIAHILRNQGFVALDTLFGQDSAFSAAAAKTIVLAQAFAFVMPDAPGKVAGIVCTVMPKRLASAGAFKPLNEMVGSGPFRYVTAERVPGVLSVYTRFED